MESLESQVSSLESEVEARQREVQSLQEYVSALQVNMEKESKVLVLCPLLLSFVESNPMGGWLDCGSGTGGHHTFLGEKSPWVATGEGSAGGRKSRCQGLSSTAGANGEELEGGSKQARGKVRLILCGHARVFPAVHLCWLLCLIAIEMLVFWMGVPT